MDLNILKKIEYSKEGVLSKEILKNSDNNVTLFSMAKNTNISEHTSSMSGFVYVIEGSGNFNLEGKDIDMVPGTLIFMAKNAKHSLRADENTSFLLLLNKKENT